MYSPRRLERAKGRGFEDSRLVLEPHSSEFRDLHLRALCPTLRYRGEELEEGDAIVVDDDRTVILSGYGSVAEATIVRATG